MLNEAIETEPAIDKTTLEVWRLRMHSLSRKLLGNQVTSRADTSDVTQESLLQFWCQQQEFRGDSDSERFAWIRKITRGHAAKIRRHHLACKRSVAATTHVFDEVHSSQSDPSTALAHSEELARLADAVALLDAELSEVVRLYFFQEKTFREIATLMNTSESSARRALARALATLKDRLSSS